MVERSPGPADWLDGVPMKMLVAGMAALAVMALVYPDSRRREVSAAAEAIHQCDLAAARNDLGEDTRQQARAHCQALRRAYRDQYGQEP
jgi:hypothetical protein